MAFRLEVRGSFKRTYRFLTNLLQTDLEKILRRAGDKGVAALASATPRDSGLTASAWGYTISASRRSPSITWTNWNINKGVPIAIILQYGHGTGGGGYVAGRDYINPAIRPIFDEIAEDVWKEMKSA